MTFLKLKQTIIIVLLTMLLVACGGGGGTHEDKTPPQKPTITQTSIDASGKVTIIGTTEKGAIVTATFPDGTTVTVTADANGNFTLTSAASQPVGNAEVTSTDSNQNTSEITLVDFSAPRKPTIQVTADSTSKLTVTGTAEKGSTVTVIFPNGTTATTTADNNGNFSITSGNPQPTGDVKVTSHDSSNNISDPVFISAKNIAKTLYFATGEIPKLSFKPSLGVNTETPQSGAVTAGNPMPFVDIFRTARPFAEFSKKPLKDAQGNYILDANGRIQYVNATTVFDGNGWPKELDPDLGYAKTKLLQGTVKNAIPSGQYTVLYDGSGTLEFSGTPLTHYAKTPNENKYVLNLDFKEIADESSFATENEYEASVSETNALNMNIKNISPANYISNIRIIMPGGSCNNLSGIHNPFISISSTDTCPTGTTYKSYEQTLATDRNTIVFNPQYLSFLRNFKVIRMMNLMEASLKDLCSDPNSCPNGVGTWAERATLNNAVWGGNDGETAPEHHKGVPIEVITKLANTLKRDIWINIPHIATDNYVSKLSEMLYQDLDATIKVYFEYSNEVWNSGFSAYNYMKEKGKSLGLNTVPAEYQGHRTSDYFARLRYHSQRSAEVFALAKQGFANDESRLVRVLGSFIGDKILTKEMLKHLISINKLTDIDAVAIAPYFYGCPTRRAAGACSIVDVLADATTVDDIFNIIDQAGIITDANGIEHTNKSLAGTIENAKKHLQLCNDHHLNLVTYEGGQHLVAGVFGNQIIESEKTRFRKLFKAVNRDSRMKSRYQTFLQKWKALSTDGASLFTLYTMPQSFYRYGNFGLKESFDKSRQESPKYDAVMSFQEAVGNCWWSNCE